MFTGSEYAWICVNMSNCDKILNIPESAKIYTNVGKYASIYLTLQIWLNMSDA